MNNDDDDDDNNNIEKQNYLFSFCLAQGPLYSLSFSALNSHTQ
jgi:hypothetical protein